MDIMKKKHYVNFICNHTGYNWSQCCEECSRIANFYYYDVILWYKYVIKCFLFDVSNAKVSISAPRAVFLGTFSLTERSFSLGLVRKQSPLQSLSSSRTPNSACKCIYKWHSIWTVFVISLGIIELRNIIEYNKSTTTTTNQNFKSTVFLPTERTCENYLNLTNLNNFKT